MNAVQVLAEARTLGLALSAGSGGKLSYEAPAGYLTPNLREALTAYKAAMLDLLGLSN